MNNIGQFLRSVRVELSKVTWPSYSEFVGSTIIVLILLVLYSIFFGVVDSSFNWLAEKVFAHYALS